MDRRSFLRGVAGVTAVSTASLAGCLGGDDSGPEAIDWIPAPEFVAGESYRVFSTAPATVGEIADRLLAIEWTADPGTLTPNQLG